MSAQAQVKKLGHARRMVEDKLAAIKRIAGQIGRWQKRVRYYERELEKSDEQRAAERAARLAKKLKNRRRKIVV